MIPNNQLVQPAIISSFLPPDNIETGPLEDYELGGVGLSDPSQGLQYQVWHMLVTGTGVSTAVYVSAPNTPSTLLFSSPNITWARLAFDQNMRPVISFVDQSGPRFWWWDPTIPGQTFTSLPSTAGVPACTMDDKRPLETRLGFNDVIISYVNNGNLVFRQERDRYNTEYVLFTNIVSIISNAFVNKIGMGIGLRLMFDVRGALYL